MCKSSYVQVITQQCGEKQLEQHLAVCILKLVRGCWQRLLHPDFGSASATEHDLWCLRTLLLQGKCNIPPSHHHLLIWARLKAVLVSRQLEGGGVAGRGVPCAFAARQPGPAAAGHCQPAHAPAQHPWPLPHCWLLPCTHITPHTLMLLNHSLHTVSRLRETFLNMS